MTDLNAYMRRVDGLVRRIAQLEARRDQLTARQSQIMQHVGVAKARIAHRDEVNVFLEELQSEAHASTTGTYADLLTSIATDVMPRPRTIGLDLYTDRGVPALDFHVVKGTKPKDIMESSGGALTNVVDLGLQMISVYKSGRRKFVALDERDPWIRPNCIPAFYQVVKQLSEEMGLQSLVISHWDVELFADGTRVVELVMGDDGVIRAEILKSPEHQEWTSEEEVGIRYIALRGVQSHKNTVIPLGKGVTALVGENDIGKSSVMRALFWASEGNCKDGDINDDCKVLEIEIGLEMGRRLVFTRDQKGKQLWQFFEKDGSLAISRKGDRCSEGGRLAPEWVVEKLGIAKVEGLDVQLSKQKEPVLLLGQKNTVRASLLSIGRESGVIRDMIALQREDNQSDNLTVRTGEKELGEINAQLAMLSTVEDLSASISAIQEMSKTVIQAAANFQAVEELVTQIEQVEVNRAYSAAVVEIVSRLPEAPELYPTGEIAALGRQIRDLQQQREYLSQGLVIARKAPQDPELEDVRTLAALIEDIERVTATREKNARLGPVLAKLPAEPQVTDVSELASLLAEIERLEVARTQARAQVQKSATDYEAVRSEIAELLAQTGNTCFECGHKIDVDELLEFTHAHAA